MPIGRLRPLCAPEILRQSLFLFDPFHLFSVFCFSIHSIPLFGWFLGWILLLPSHLDLLSVSAHPSKNVCSQVTGNLLPYESFHLARMAQNVDFRTMSIFCNLLRLCAPSWLPGSNKGGAINAPRCANGRHIWLPDRKAVNRLPVTSEVFECWNLSLNSGNVDVTHCWDV